MSVINHLPCEDEQVNAMSVGGRERGAMVDDRERRGKRVERGLMVKLTEFQRGPVSC